MRFAHSTGCGCEDCNYVWCGEIEGQAIAESTVSAIMAEFARRQKRASRPCQMCGKTANMRAGQRWCSNACRVKAYQQRRKAYNDHA